MRVGSCKIQFVAHNVFSPRYDMPKNVAHILQDVLKSHGSHLMQPVHAITDVEQRAPSSGAH